MAVRQTLSSPSRIAFNTTTLSHSIALERIHTSDLDILRRISHHGLLVIPQT